MDNKTATLIGAAAALAGGPALAAAPSTEPAVPVAASYAELLTPIPNMGAVGPGLGVAAPPRYGELDRLRWKTVAVDAISDGRHEGPSTGRRVRDGNALGGQPVR